MWRICTLRFEYCALMRVKDERARYFFEQEVAEYGKQVSTAGNYKKSPESQQRLWDKGEN